MTHQQSPQDPVITHTLCNGRERFIFRYRWSRRAEILQIAAAYLSRPDPEFTIFDLLGLAHLIAVREAVALISTPQSPSPSEKGEQP